ncbi:hypothetical protein ACWH4V_19750 [Bacillus mojavensis]|uniref:hypothetical protein n=1 Tax=Bacillus sp. XT-2 TaxID=2856852 RepID=UPI0021E107E6|nr:hypothetical protein [Bacillus sp. XT-2]MCV0023763.1 hypothetical protein [Bacillus sp. XT-2]
MHADHRLYCISRQNNQKLIDLDSSDLRDSHGIEALFDELFQRVSLDTEPEGIYVINNAGVLASLGRSNNKTEELKKQPAY